MNVNVKWNMCLVCLAESDNVINTMKSVYEKDLENVVLLEKIISCGGIEINENKNLPNHICKKCVSDLDVAFKFRTRCQNANAYFKSKTNGACSSIDLTEPELKEFVSDTRKSIEVKVNNQLFQIDYLEDESFDNIDQEISIENVSNDNMHSFSTVCKDGEDTVKTFENSEFIEPLPIQNHNLVINNFSGKNYPTAKNAIRPNSFKRKVKENFSFECDVCGNNYSMKTELMTHKKTHLMVIFGMEDLQPKRPKVYNTWTKDEKRILVEKRIQNDHLFKGLNSNGVRCWRDILNELQPLLGEGKTAEGCKGQWRALLAKYRHFISYTFDGGTRKEIIDEDALDWELFDIFHSYAKSKQNYDPKIRILSSSQVT